MLPDCPFPALAPQAVSLLGPKWTAVSGHVPGRTARQCRERYVNLLQPDLKFQEFSKEEEEVRLQACLCILHGNRCTLVAGSCMHLVPHGGDHPDCGRVGSPRAVAAPMPSLADQLAD